MNISVLLVSWFCRTLLSPSLVAVQGQVSGSCGDSNTSCSEWAARGECQRNPSYMDANCRKSCNKCARARSTGECRFPFIYKEVRYTACTAKDDPKQQLWCSTKTDNQDNHILQQGFWRYCRGPTFCRFPFIFQNVEYTTCTTSGAPDGKPWCSGRTDNRNNHIQGNWRPCMKCGNNIETERILGGEDAKLGSWPWMVIFLGREKSVGGSATGLVNWFCGGVLIAEQFVLSAAHCFTNQQIDFVRIGELDLGTNPDRDITRRLEAPPPQDISAERVIIHPSYKSPCRRCNDIALVKLEQPAQYHQYYVQPICLPSNPDRDMGFSASTFQDNKSGMATGWGLTDNTAVIGADKLQQVELLFNERPFCRRQKDNFPNSRMILCAGEGDGKDICRADSGGPIMLTDSKLQRYYVVGISSYGATVCGSRDSQSIFTNVHHYKDWINQNIEINNYLF